MNTDNAVGVYRGTLESLKIAVLSPAAWWAVYYESQDADVFDDDVVRAHEDVAHSAYDYGRHEP